MIACYDAIVVGAGPAGSVAAMVLAAGGRRVALLEKDRHPRYKTCGGGVVARALAALPCPPPTSADIPLRTTRKIGLHLRGARPIVLERAEPAVTMVMRADFDRYLAQRAAEAGAELIEACTLREILPAGDLLRCRAGERQLEAPVLIGADGAESRVARFLPGAAADGSLGVALEGELVPRNGGEDWSWDETRFDVDALRGGYGWIFPKEAHLSVGVFSRRRRVRAFRERYHVYREQHGLGGAAAVEERLTGHRIPVRPRRVRARGPVLLAGDAAGLCDPLTGEGISFAIRSGRLAGEAVLAAGDEPQRAAAEYEARLAVLLREIRAARLVAWGIYAAPALAFRTFERHPSFAEAVADVFMGRRTYSELLSRALLHPWRLI